MGREAGRGGGPAFGGALLLASLALPLSAGCRDAEPITQYTIPTEVPPQLLSEDRMLGAMVPRGSNVWFFKVVGPADAVESVAGDVQAFVQGVRFENDSPVWDLPQSWRQRDTAGPMRFATIDIPTASNQLELSVSPLPRTEPWDEQVASNVNRWRGQLGLEASSTEWAGAEPLEVASADDAGAAWVDLKGDFGGGPAMTPPMAGGAMAGGAMAGGAMAPFAGSAAGESAAPAAGSEALDYATPEGWRAGRSGGMRMAAFVAGPDDAAEITVIAAGGDLRSNVARWLEQLHGQKVADEVVDAAMADAQEVTVGEARGQRFVLEGEEEPPQAMDVTVVPQQDGISLFVKMTGPADVVRQQHDAMSDFLASLRPRQ